MISKAAKIALYAERFAELTKMASDTDEFISYFMRLVELINNGSISEAVNVFFELNQQLGDQSRTVLKSLKSYISESDLALFAAELHKSLEQNDATVE